MKNYQIVILSSLFVFCACTSSTEEQLEPTIEVPDFKMVYITVTLPQPIEEPMTRTDVQKTYNESTGKWRTTYSWALNDTLGIFPVKGGQVEFPIPPEATGQTTVRFNGGSWMLRKNGEYYAAYFPYDKWNIFRDSKTILVDYEGQTQEGLNSSAHLGNYDYRADGAKPTYEDTDGYGNVSWEMNQVGAVYSLGIRFPENTGSLKVLSMSLVADEAIFSKTMNIDISNSTPVVTPKAKFDTMTLKVTADSFVPSDYQYFHMMLAPVDMTSKVITVRVLTDKGYYEGVVQSKNVQAGHSYTTLLDVSFKDSASTEAFVEDNN